MTIILASILLFAAAYLGYYGSPISMSVLGAGALVVVQIGRIHSLLKEMCFDATDKAD